jgi:hypothetical protein
VLDKSLVLLQEVPSGRKLSLCEWFGINIFDGTSGFLELEIYIHYGRSSCGTSNAMGLIEHCQGRKFGCTNMNHGTYPRHRARKCDSLFICVQFKPCWIPTLFK